MWAGLNKFKLFILVVLFSLPLSFSAVPGDLNLFVVDSPPFYVGNDLNFGVSWTGGALEGLYVSWGDDSNSNSFEVAGELTYTENGADGRISTPVARTLSAGYTEWNFVVDLNFTGSASHFVILAGEGTTFNQNTEETYNLFVNGSDGSGALRYGDGLGGSTNVIAFGAGTFTTLTPTQVKVTRSAAGAWELFVNGGSVGTGSNTSFTAMASMWLDFRRMGSNITNITVGTTAGGADLLNDNFSDGNYSSPPVWTVQAGSWAVLGSPAQVTTPVYELHDYNTAGVKNLVATAENADGNSVATLQMTLVADTNAPTLILTDFNIITGFHSGTIDFNASYGIGCSDNASSILDVNIINNDTNILAQGLASDTNAYINATDVFIGANTIKYNCKDGAGNLTTATLNRNIFGGNFYFVYDSTGVALTGASDYTLGDINSLRVYSSDLNTFIDMFATGAVSISYIGNSTDRLEFRLGYTDPTYPFTSRTFNLDVLDTNSTAVCFSPLQTFYQQLLYSSSERDIILKNAHTGCYHLAGTTNFAYTDFYALNAYTIPQSYNLYLVQDDNSTLIAVVEGSSSGLINLDALILKQEFAQTLVIAGEGATIQKNCSDGISDCNTFVVYYLNSAQNNSEIEVEIFNGSTLLLSHTETTNPNAFTYIFDSTSLDFDANVLKLTVTATRTNTDTKTFNVYFTPQGAVGYIDPVMAIIISFVIFVGGITLVSTRLVFGWFGALIALMAIAFLSFSVGNWWVTFAQAIMLSMLIYIGISFTQAQSGAV